MRYALSDLVRYKARIGQEDDRFGVSEVFFSSTDWEPRYIALEIGSWLDREHVIVRFDLVGEIHTEDRELQIRATRDDVEAAPHWDGAVLPQPVAGTGALPGLVAGSFGAQSTRLAVAPPAPPEDTNDPEAVRIEETLERVSVWRGMDVIGTDGPLGHVDDLLMDKDSRRITDVVVDHGAFLTGRQLIVPVSKVAGIDEAGREVTMALTNDELEHAPQIEESDGIDRNWLDTVRTYYQLPI